MKTEYARVDPRDVVQMVNGIHGVYPARDLYERYCEIARENQRHPGHITAVGQVLVKLGLSRRKKQGKTLYSIW